MYERKNETFLLGFVCVDTLVQRRYSSPSGFRKKDRVERRRKREGKREREKGMEQRGEGWLVEKSALSFTLLVGSSLRGG